MYYFQHIMLDVETLGTDANAITFQVGALAFNEKDDQVMEASWYVDIDDQIKQGQLLSSSTLEWWSQQPLFPETFAAYAKSKVALYVFASQFRGWISNHSTDRTLFWANGVAFDIPKIERLLGGEFCKFWKIMDYRTMKTMCYVPNPVAPNGTYGPAHDALADCRAQAARLKLILKKLKGEPASAPVA